MDSRYLSLVANERLLPFWEAIAWSAVENSVMFGELNISELTDDQVLIEAFGLALGITHEGEGDGELATGSGHDEVSQKEILWASNHEPDLKKQADEFLSNGKCEFAILFYATWSEHWVNRIILLRSIGHGTPPDLATALIRGSRLELKIGKLWTALGMPRFERDLARRVAQVTEARNAFVHYKWPSSTDEEHSQSIKSKEVYAREAKSTIESLIKLEDEVFYDGRTESIKAAFRNDWRARAAEAKEAADSDS